MSLFPYIADRRIHFLVLMMRQLIYRILKTFQGRTEFGFDKIQ